MIAAPIPWMHATLNPPIKLQTLIYTNILWFPHRGPAKNMMMVQASITVPVNAKKPGAITNPCISSIVETCACLGALTTMTVEPTIHSTQPIFPMNESRSLRKMDERIAVTTTD